MSGGQLERSRKLNSEGLEVRVLQQNAKLAVLFRRWCILWSFQNSSVFGLHAYIISAVQVFVHKLCPLQGLIPRATSLAQLGGSFFLAFLPAVLVISLLFSAIYFVSFRPRSNVQSIVMLEQTASA